MMDRENYANAQEAESAMNHMLMQLVHPLVDRPDQFSVEVLHRGDAATFVVQVAPDDIEKFIGPNMRTGRSLQIIVNAVGMKSQRKFFLSFRDNAPGKGARTEVLPETASN